MSFGVGGRIAGIPQERATHYINKGVMHREFFLYCDSVKKISCIVEGNKGTVTLEFLCVKAI